MKERIWDTRYDPEIPRHRQDTTPGLDPTHPQQQLFGGGVAGEGGGRGRERERERGRERAREGQGERKRERDRETDRQTQTQKEKRWQEPCFYFKLQHNRKHGRRSMHTSTQGIGR